MIVLQHITDFVIGPFLVWPLAIWDFLSVAYNKKFSEDASSRTLAKLQITGWLLICVVIAYAVLAITKTIMGPTQNGWASPGITWLVLIVIVLVHVNAYTTAIVHMEANIEHNATPFMNSWFKGTLYFVLECVLIIDMILHRLYIQ